MSKRITARYRVVYDDDGLTPLPGFLNDWEPIAFGSDAVTYTPDERAHDEETARTRFRDLIETKKVALEEIKAEKERLKEEERLEKERLKEEERLEKERLKEEKEEEMLGGI